MSATRVEISLIFALLAAARIRFFFFYYSNALFRAIRKQRAPAREIVRQARQRKEEKNMNIKNTRRWRERQRGNAANAECYPTHADIRCHCPSVFQRKSASGIAFARIPPETRTERGPTRRRQNRAKLQQPERRP